MVDLFAQFWRFCGAVLLCGVVSASANATGVQFAGSVGWSGDYASFAILVIDDVHNSDAVGSAALRVELWASLSPFSGSFASNYRLSTYGVGALAAGASTGKITAIVPFSPPPGGTWHFAMVLTESAGASTNDGYVVRNYLDFPDTIFFSGPPPPPPTDTTAPTISITSPTAGNVSGAVNVSANASDNVGVTRVDFYVNGSLAGSDSAAPYQYSWNTTALPNGTATLRALAFDAAGNSGQSALVAVTVANGPPPDTTPPTVSIASPTGGNVSGTVSISANASDNVGVARVDFYVNGSLAGSDSAAPYQYSWNTTSSANGAATLRAVAFDAAGNSTQSAVVNVTVANAPPPDTTPPIASIASPTGGNVSGTVAISANASDNVGVMRVDFYINGALVGSDSTAPYQYSWSTTASANGATTLRVVAFDAAGNSGQSSLVTVTVANGPPPDTTPPTVAITAPSAGNVSGIVTIAANASDNVGVTRVDFYVNGALFGSDSAAPWQLSWNTASGANGSTTLHAIAYDAAGNSASSATVSVTVANAGTPPPPADSVPPTAAIASPSAGSVSGVVPVLINASDNVGVVRVDLFANGQLAASDSAAPWQFSWNSATVADGAAQLQAVAYDAAGNAGASSIVAVTVANAASPPPPPPPPSVTTGHAIEYYNAALDHYFITASQAEMDVLDSGTLAGWARTGLAFKVYAQATSGASPVCRIYIPAPYGNSHFFSASATECSEAIVKYPFFIYEAGDVFYIDTPDASGTCPSGDTPVYRLWNNRPDTNHRYTTSLQIKELMVAEGYIAEGYGIDAVMMCSPP